MPEQVDVFYEGWGEKWLWGKLVSSTALTGRPLIAFEYSEDAIRKGLELSRLTLPLNGARLRKDFPAHQLGLPGPVYDSLPDGWGMLLMDRPRTKRSAHRSFGEVNLGRQQRDGRHDVPACSAGCRTDIKRRCSS